MSRNRCICRCRWWFTWWCNQEYTFESLHTSFISYIEQKKQNCRHSQIRFRRRHSQVFTAVYRKKLIHEYLFLLNLQTERLKKGSTRDFFQWVCLILQNSFLWNMFGQWLLLPNTIHFLWCIDLTSNMLLSTLAIFWLSLNIFKANTVSRLWTAASGSPTQLADFLLIKVAIRPKCS